MRGLIGCRLAIWASTCEPQSSPLRIALAACSFFVISGFLMCQILSKRLPLDASKCADFAYRRVKRIVPLYLLSILLVLVAAAAWFLQSFDYRSLYTKTLKPLVFAANMLSDQEVDYFHPVSALFYESSESLLCLFSKQFLTLAESRRSLRFLQASLEPRRRDSILYFRAGACRCTWSIAKLIVEARCSRRPHRRLLRLTSAFARQFRAHGAYKSRVAVCTRLCRL